MRKDIRSLSTKSEKKKWIAHVTNNWDSMNFKNCAKTFYGAIVILFSECKPPARPLYQLKYIICGNCSTCEN